jgi:FtsP/CotA-like multicopper oxidase with cupredoxin domain
MKLTASQIRRFGLMLVLLCTWCMPQLAGAGVAKPIPTGPLDAQGKPNVPDYYTTANWANSPPLNKFVDTLPLLGKANNLGQKLTVAKPDVTSYPGSDYYEIDLVQYREQLHSDLPNGTLLRGYVQVNKGSNVSAGTLPSQNMCGADKHACSAADLVAAPDAVHYLGPIIVSERDRPVRIKFTNKLPSGPAGDLFIPVDTSVMGAGSGPANAGGTRGAGTPCDSTANNNTCASYTQNRADLHLHGGRTPWISDGTPHQWITPASEITPFTKGVSLQNVPDMPDPGDGSSTYYYTNQQSARLMFYHDHAWGITRLNVYAGEAAGYVITDQWEQDLVNRGLVPPDQIPLIIQDKTFVDANPALEPRSGLTMPRVRVTDPLWNWGSGPLSNGVREPMTGDLWLPHVYMPAQTMAAGFGGVNPFGRWMYGPWFYPATVVEKGPVPNPYYDADCSSPFPAVYAKCTTPGQPTMIPGTPNTSMGMEAFQDSAVVNGTVFPTLTVDPRAYRFRILNAANDRFWNLSFYEADPAQVSPDARLLNAGRSNLTEVKTVPASASLAIANNWPVDWPVDGRDGGVPDPATMGPSWLQIGTEGGFLPQPVTINPQPITYITDPTAFWVGNVDKMGLALGPAERADVVVDFSQYAGKTLILYNDAPAAWPARVAGYDYYTGAPDLRDSGGYGTGGTWDNVTKSWVGGTGPMVGKAPNTRTVMQVIVRNTAGTDVPYSFDPTALANEFTSAAAVTPINPAPVKTLFERAQEPIIVGQTAYKDAYPNSYFPPNFPWEGINQINDHFLNFVTVDGKPVVATTEPKGIHDEMGASFDPIYGRMSGNLGMQLPNPTTLTALLILYGFPDIPTETIQNSTQVNVQVIPDDPTDPYSLNKLGDGTQIWKISHNGVDTHPIHFHIFDVQVINRVGWDGQILLPEPNELGWKDTVKISPLEDTIVAVRPRAPMLPFGIANSLRPLNPAIPLGSGMGFNSIDWTTGQAITPAVTNELFDFGWEYVWHCHILSHEEMDMMRPIVLKVKEDMPAAPGNVAAQRGATANDVRLTWTDPTPVNYVTLGGFGNTQGEIGFIVERSSDGTTFTQVGSTLANAQSFIDTTIGAGGTTLIYRVKGYNAAGSGPSAAIGYVVPVIDATGASMTFNPAGTTTIGKIVTLTGSGTGGNGPYEYQFWFRPAAGGTFTQIQAWSASKTASWNTLGLAAGTYTVQVNVRVKGSTSQFGAFANYSYALTVPPEATAASMTFSPATKATIGTIVTLTGAGQGGTGTYQYKFYYRPAAGGTFQLIRDWSTSNTASWNTLGLAAGTYTVQVDVRSLGSTSQFGAFTNYSYTLTVPPEATGANLTFSPSSPQKVGTKVLLTGSGQGGTGTYQFKYYVRPVGSTNPFTLLRDWSTTPTYTWDTTGMTTGAYTIQIDVRSLGSTSTFGFFRNFTYTLN